MHPRHRLNPGHRSGATRGPLWRASAIATATLALALGASCACPPKSPEDVRATLPEVFPHVRFDKTSRTVEIDARVAVDCHQPTTPRVYLEVTACTPDSREYESLVVTPARPSHVHAALLLAGLNPGRPGRFENSGASLRAVPPAGDSLRVTFVLRDEQGASVEVEPLDWVIDTGTREHLRAPGGSPTWVFGGSRIVEFQGTERYEADLTGTLIGLTTFGDEPVSFSRVMSPESAVQEPEWIADIERVPPIGTPVVIRIRPRD